MGGGWGCHGYGPPCVREGLLHSPVLERRPVPVLLLLAVLSPRIRTEMPLKLLALVMAGRRFRLELSESVLLQGRGSEYLGSVSALLWRLLPERASPRLGGGGGGGAEVGGGCGGEGTLGG